MILHHGLDQKDLKNSRLSANAIESFEITVFSDERAVVLRNPAPFYLQSGSSPQRLRNACHGISVSVSIPLVVLKRCV